MTVALALGCASSGSPSGAPDPEMQLVQLSNVADVARNVTGGIAVQYQLTIHNTTPNTLHLKRVELQSIGAGAYTLPSLSQAFDRTIDPGETAAIDLRGAAYIADATIAGANGPVTIRAIAQFDSSAGRQQTVVVQQVHPNGSV